MRALSAASIGQRLAKLGRGRSTARAIGRGALDGADSGLLLHSNESVSRALMLAYSSPKSRESGVWRL